MGAAQKAYKKGCEDFQNEYFEQVASRCGLARTGPNAAVSRVQSGTRSRKMSMSIAKAESAVLDSAAQEKEAHKSLQAVQAQERSC